jgi:CubicO group peptidase (beta-lactamase class C family)
MKRWRTRSFAARCLVAAALAVFLTAGGPPEGRAESANSTAASFSRADLDRFGDLVRNEVASRKIPGAVLLIQQHGSQVYLESFGVRSVATRMPMTPDTIFRIYSMSKAVTSVAIMMLAEEGKLSIDDPVSKFIPAFADAKVGVDLSDEAGQYPLKLEPLKRPITILDLLRHTSGITYGFYGEGQIKKLYANPALYRGDFDNAEFAGRIAKLPLADQPGVRWDYGHSTDILGRVVEVASGQQLLQFEKQRLLDPLGMTDTGFYVADKTQWSRIAEPFPDKRFGRRMRFGRPIAGVMSPALPRRWESGGAGMVSTAPDYARFLQMLLNGGELDGRRYLKPETVALMASDHIGPKTGILHDPFYFPGPGSGFGLGFAVRTAPPPNTTWPLGEYRWDAAGGSFYFVDPKDDMLVVFMVQAPEQGGRIQLALKTLIYETMGKGLRKD